MKINLEIELFNIEFKEENILEYKIGVKSSTPMYTKTEYPIENISKSFSDIEKAKEYIDLIVNEIISHFPLSEENIKTKF
ncbi:hypothetical protein [Algoriella sp.]|uniref:hypothetical protein n=1 Tax=Algoriella sp. TaxID=1872434 RepID=UPI002FCA8DB4